MRHIGIALVYLGFFGLIAFSIWYTKNPHCLWALLLAPSYEYDDSNANKEKISK